MKIDAELGSKVYKIECYKYNSMLREFNRQEDFALFTRLALSKDKNAILELAKHDQVFEKRKV